MPQPIETGHFELYELTLEQAKKYVEDDIEDFRYTYRRYVDFLAMTGLERLMSHWEGCAETGMDEPEIRKRATALFNAEQPEMALSDDTADRLFDRAENWGRAWDYLHDGNLEFFRSFSRAAMHGEGTHWGIDDPDAPSNDSSEANRRAANVRHSNPNNPANIARAKVKAKWKEWKQGRARYLNDDDFARKMMVDPDIAAGYTNERSIANLARKLANM